MLPLFSATSSRSWGIGELPDLVPLARWMASGGFDRLMILPIGVVSPGSTSPYSSESAMAIDAGYIALEDVVDFHAAGGIDALSAESRADLDVARAAARVDYARVHRVKDEALALAFQRFYRDEWEQLSMRAAALGGFMSRERWWLDDWALYASIAEAQHEQDWRRWPEPLRDRHPEAMGEARRQLGFDVLRHQYVQWLADEQWNRARATARDLGVTVFGDMPFMVLAESPDVWMRPNEFMFDVSLGVPPDAFSDTGQDWSLPTYRWDRIAQTGYAWMRQRARRMAELYDGYRVDHLVGLFRTYGRPVEGEPFFNPSTEHEQRAQGEAILRILLEARGVIIAEDLGVVPDFVRESIARLDVPGCKVMRWERDWNASGHPFRDPASYPARSAAMTGTHDTETLAEWWARTAPAERQAALDIPALRAAGLTDPAAAWNDHVRDAWLSAGYGSASDELFMPLQDVFGWTDRINIPATVGAHNWTWRLPYRVDQLAEQRDAADRAAFCRQLARQTQRSEAGGDRVS
jgi:4-alpha-glucanotransferase